MAKGQSKITQNASSPARRKLSNAEKLTQRLVRDWTRANKANAKKFALNPPDTIKVGGITLTNITEGGGKPKKKRRDYKTTEFTTEWRTTKRTAGDKWTTMQVSVLEKLKSDGYRIVGTFGAKDDREYIFDKNLTKLK